jgi:hypothetical protein
MHTKGNVNTTFCLLKKIDPPVLLGSCQDAVELIGIQVQFYVSSKIRIRSGDRETYDLRRLARGRGRRFAKKISRKKTDASLMSEGQRQRTRKNG